MPSYIAKHKKALVLFFHRMDAYLPTDFFQAYIIIGKGPEAPIAYEGFLS